MKQSSIDWLIEKLIDHQMDFYGNSSIPLRTIAEAKAIHKDEIIDAYKKGAEGARHDYYDPTDHYYSTFNIKIE